MYILNGSGTFPETKVFCTYHLDGICTFILSVYGVLFYCSAFIWVTFSIYDSSTGLNMLSKSAYNINGNMNWHWPLQNFGNFSFSEGIFTLTWPFFLQYSLGLSLDETVQKPFKFKTVYAKGIRVASFQIR